MFFFTSTTRAAFFRDLFRHLRQICLWKGAIHSRDEQAFTRCEDGTDEPIVFAIGHRPNTLEVWMKALIFRETGEPKSVLKLEEIPAPPLAPGEALVRVLLSPINASDLHMVRG